MRCLDWPHFHLCEYPCGSSCTCYGNVVDGKLEPYHFDYFVFPTALIFLNLYDLYTKKSADVCRIVGTCASEVTDIYICLTDEFVHGFVHLLLVSECFSDLGESFVHDLLFFGCGDYLLDLCFYSGNGVSHVGVLFCRMSIILGSMWIMFFVLALCCRPLLRMSSHYFDRLLGVIVVRCLLGSVSDV